jgi:hypothetical protein
MHPVLLLDEVLRMILDHIDHDSNRIPALKTFYRLATVCRAWKDPALDYLWASLFSVDPLLALLPHVSIVLLRNTLGVLNKTECVMYYRVHHAVMSPLMPLHDFMHMLRGFET